MTGQKKKKGCAKKRWVTCESKREAWSLTTDGTTIADLFERALPLYFVRLLFANCESGILFMFVSSVWLA